VPPLRKPIPFGKYYLLERINVGGMAEVFRAKAYGVEGFERLVAVKRILPNIAEDKDFIRMFIDEAKIAVQLSHANVAQIFDLGVVETDYYIALEHIHGRDLRAIFDRCRQRTDGKGEVGDPMPIAQACFVIMKVCEGLDYAHNKRDQSGRELNLVHRDVSPQNVLVSFEGEVKLIDFGIAKAAGKGSKTQAGILKGKFGYMSPEQVRGLPIDRRSDVFSCGIVLYELLTGERLFVGESDFSTLEKVRNVEILPPSTYNRRIPDELERIVLKALAKDSEERYQSAIDLHDELQAFVYTAGEFYSRKDLAGWMKVTFAAEIEEETAKLESFRNMSPPDRAGQTSQGAAPARPRTNPPAAQPPRRATLSMNAVVPPPAVHRPTVSVPPANGRPAQSPVAAAATAAAAPRIPAVGAHEPLEWDDDELETAIYADKEGSGRPRAEPEPAPVAAAEPVRSKPTRQSQVGPVAGLPASPSRVVKTPEQPDLVNLARTARAWPPPGGVSPRTRNGGHPDSPFADGSGSPVPPVTDLRDTTMVDRRPAFESDTHAEPSAVLELAALSRSRAQPLPPDSAPISFGSSFLHAHGHGRRRLPRIHIDFRRLRTSTVVQIAVTALVGVAIAVLVYLITSGGSHRKSGDGQAQASGPAAKGSPAATPPAPVAAPPAPISVDPASGFDLIVDPAGVVVKLDGRPIGKAPLQIRNLVDGNHLVEVDGPPGFFNKSQPVQVTRGTAHRVVLKLDAMQITGTFTSEPPGARVTLVVDGEKRLLGVTPTKAALDPRRRYEVVFRRDGYQPAIRPITMTGASELAISAVLERAGRGGAVPAYAPLRRPRVVAAPATQPDGALGIMAKPPCRIFIDGRDTGQKTPQVGIQLRPGRHRVTLINDEFGLKETFVVEIQPGETMKMIKDLTSQLPTPGGAPAPTPAPPATSGSATPAPGPASSPPPPP
jgi:eukaryotic-like serine/threonine-protein kinase